MMKAFFAGVCAVIVLGALTGIAYDFAAVSMVEGFGTEGSIHVAVGHE